MSIIVLTIIKSRVGKIYVPAPYYFATDFCPPYKLSIFNFPLFSSTLQYFLFDSDGKYQFVM